MYALRNLFFFFKLHLLTAQVWYVLRDKARWVVLDSRSGRPERVKGTGLRREFGQIFVLRLLQADSEAAARLKSMPRVQEAPAP